MKDAPNRQWWDEVTPRHVNSDFYDMSGFLAGRNTVGATELKALGNVKNKRIVHLMCHFGMDTLSLARMGADVTGVDFSERSIQTANQLRAQLGLGHCSRFICADILNLSQLLNEKFDIVFTSHGVLEWLPELAQWGATIARSLRSDGYFYMMEIHPFSLIFDELDGKQLNPINNYFSGERDLAYFDKTDYADRSYHPLSPRTKRLWRIDEIFASLRSNGLEVSEFKEYPFSTYKALPMMERREDGLWYDCGRY